MNTDSDQTTLAQIKNSHRRAARLAARTGFVPKEFKTDPTFLDLVSTIRHEQAELCE